MKKISLKVHCHAIQWFFLSIFLRQKNGADPTEAAPDQTNRGAGLVKIRASQSRDSACGNGSKGVEGLRCDLRCEGELKSSCTCFSHHLVLPRYQAFFSSFCLFPGGTPPIVHSPNVDASGLFADLLSSNPVPEGLPNRGQRQERPRLAGAHNSACRQSTRKVLSSNWLLPVSTAREIERDRLRKVDQHACFNNSWRSRIYASVRAAEVALTSDHRVPKSLHPIDRLRKVGSCEALRPWKSHGRHYFSPQQNGAKNYWIAWQCTFKKYPSPPPETNKMSLSGSHQSQLLMMKEWSLHSSQSAPIIADLIDLRKKHLTASKHLVNLTNLWVMAEILKPPAHLATNSSARWNQMKVSLRLRNFRYCFLLGLSFI